MRTQHTERPLPHELREREARLKAEIAEIQADYQRRVAPLVAELLELERFRPPPIFYLIPETDAEREQIDAALPLRRG